MTIINYQTAVLRKDFEEAQKILPKIPNEHRNRIAQFLDAQGLKEQALEVSLDSDHKFELAVQVFSCSVNVYVLFQLGKLDIALEIAKESATEQKWKQLADLAMNSGKVLFHFIYIVTIPVWTR